MQNNWYIIYTKPKCEKKVAATLKKRKIENFLPLQYRQINTFRGPKTQQEPLFKSYVFAKFAENEIFNLKNMDGAINFVYWKGVPAKITNHDIQLLKDFIATHDDIGLEKSTVNIFDEATVIDGARYRVAGNIVTIKNTVSKVKLPSLGFTLVAKAGTTAAIQSENAFGEKDLLLQ